MAALTISATGVKPTSTTTLQTVTAGATITAGMAVYSDATDSGDYKPANADTLASAAVKGIAMCGASDGQKLVIATGGDITLTGTTMAVGVTYFLHTTGGGIGLLSELAAGAFPTFVGHATTATNLKLNIAISTIALAA